MSVEKSDQSGRTVTSVGSNLDRYFSRLNKYTNISFIFGLLIGILLTSTAVSGYLYWDSLDHRTSVPITIVTCDSCEYERFTNATDRMIKAEYREVDYQSPEGQELIQEYNLKYIPGFIFERGPLEKAENFTSMRTTLAESDGAYLLPDEGIEAAQRLSKGQYLDES